MFDLFAILFIIILVCAGGVPAYLIPVPETSFMNRYLQYTTIIFNFQKFSDRFMGDLGISLLVCIIFTAWVYVKYISGIVGASVIQKILYGLIVFLFFHMTYSTFSIIFQGGCCKFRMIF